VFVIEINWLMQGQAMDLEFLPKKMLVDHWTIVHTPHIILPIQHSRDLLFEIGNYNIALAAE
jgi:hypothetical protein